MAFDVDSALKAGYTRSEIADYLASKNNFDVAGARKAGYNDDEILSHLIGSSKPKQDTAQAKPAAPSGQYADVAPVDYNQAATDMQRTPSAKVEVAPTASNKPEQGFFERLSKEPTYLGAAVERGWNTLQAAINGRKMAEYGELLDSFNRSYTPEQIAADPKLQEEKRLREEAFARLAQENAALSKKTEEILKSDRTRPETKQMFNADGGKRGWVDSAAEIGKALIKDPGSVVDLTLSSGPSTLASAATAAVAFFGTRNPTLAAAAGGAGSGYIEFGNEYADNRAQGMSHDEAWKSAMAKAGVVGTLDAVSMKTAGKALDVVSEAVKQGATKVAVKEVAKETSRQAALGAAGEAGGSLAAGKEVDPTSVLLEAINETVSAPVEAVSTQRTINQAISPERQFANTLNQAVENAQFVVPADQVARERLSPDSYDPASISPTLTTRQPTDVGPAIPPGLIMGAAAQPPEPLQPTAEQRKLEAERALQNAGSATEAAAAANAVAGTVDELTADTEGQLAANRAAIAAQNLVQAPNLNIPPIISPAGDVGPPIGPAALPAAPAQVSDLGAQAPLIDNQVEQQFGFDKLRLQPINAPRPQRIQGTPVDQMTDEQLEQIAQDETIPAITRRGASVELTARRADNAQTTQANTRVEPTLTTIPAVAPAADGRVEPTVTGSFLAINEPAMRDIPASPVGGPVVAARARETAQQGVDAWAAQTGQPVPAVFNPAPPQLDAAVNEIAQAVNSQFAGRIYAYNDPRPESVNGLAMGGVAFVNTANVNVNAARTSLHEFHHTVEQIAKAEQRQGLTDTPAQQYVASMDSVFNDMTDAGKRAYLENFLAKDELDAIADPAAREARLQELLADPLTRSEMTADFLGNRATDKKFWQDIAAADPEGFKGFVEKWLRIIDSLIAQLRGIKTQGRKESARVDKYVQDLNKAKMVAREALIAYSRATRTQTAAPAQAATAPQLSATQGVTPGATSVTEKGTTVPNAGPQRSERQGETPAGVSTPEEVSDTGARQYKLDITREERETAKSAALAADEQAAMLRDAKANNIPEARLRELLAEARETKKRYPRSGGWVPLKVLGLAIDPKDGKASVKYKKEAYAYNRPPGATRAPAKMDQEWATRVADEFEKLVLDIYRRGESGDKNAQIIIGHQTWYRNVAAVLRAQYGGFGDLLADLLGATSPNTPVDTNWQFSIDAMSRFVRGDFNKELAKFDRYVKAGNAVSKYPSADKIKQITGKLYGMNSGNAMVALLDMWRIIEPGSAPKARNFALNLIGQSNMATIDVWAARMLRRAADLVKGNSLPRIPPPAEQGVSGTWNADASAVTGEFGFGATVMEDVAQRLRARGYDVTAPDLQAIAWFAEKELWGQKGWTTKTGEGGSFEENIEKMPVQRFVGGISIQQGEAAPQQEDVSLAQARLMSLLSGDSSVIAARAMPTRGLYGGVVEESFDVEIAAKAGEFDPSMLLAEMARLSKEYPQYDFFLSEALAPGQNSPNARPGIELYFKTKKDLESVMPVLEAFTSRGQDGFTLAVDPRAKDGEYIGVRLQYVPEISMRWDEDLRARLQQPGELEAELQVKENAMVDVVESLVADDSVAYVSVVKYDTLVVGKEDYDGLIDRIAAGADRASGETSWFGKPIRAHVERAAARLNRDAGQERETSVYGASADVSQSRREVVSTDASAADENLQFSRRQKPAPKKTVTAYKLFRVDARKPGQLFPLFVNANDPVEMGVWLDADIGEAAPPTKTGKPQVKSKLGGLAMRPGWHAADLPIATHIGERPEPRLDEESGTVKQLPTIRPANQVWVEIEMADDRDWQTEADRRATPYKINNPKTGAVKGQPNPATAQITDGIPEDGYYRYKTNPNMTGNWMIGGSIKVNRILSDTEVERINKEAGVADLPREQPFDVAKYGFDAKLSRRQGTSPFYSQLAVAIADVPARLETQPAQQWKAWLASNASKLGIKKEEIEWTGINEYLDLRGKDKVTKAEIGEYLKANGVQVEEVMLGGPNLTYEDWLAKNPEVMDLSEEERDAQFDALSEATGATKYQQYVLPGGTNYREVALTLPGKEIYRVPKQHSMGEKADVNRIAHIRMNDRTDADGNRVLFIEEIQSDWAQEGRKKGFQVQGGNLTPAENARLTELSLKNPDAMTKEENKELMRLMAKMPLSESEKLANKNRVSSAPFVQNTKAWVALATKRMIAYAVDNGFDKVAFVNGQQSADRYDLSRQIDSVQYHPDNKAIVVMKDGDIVIAETGATEKRIEDLIGKDLTKKLLEQKTTPAKNKKYGDKAKTLSGLDLKVGGEGMVAFYDQIVPQVVNDVLKKVGGGKLETTTLQTKDSVRGNQEYTYSILTNIERSGDTTIAVVDAKTNEQVAGPFKTNEDARAWLQANDPVLKTEQLAFTIADGMKAKVEEGLPLFSRRQRQQSGAQLSRRRPQVDTPEFKRWFGDSKVVDENGDPKIVYHTTPSQNLDDRPFTEFDEGINYFSEIADRTYGDFAYPVYLSIKNPYDFSKVKNKDGAYEYEDGTVALDEDDEPITIGWLKENEYVVEDMINRGYDGAIDGPNFIVVFDNRQIKSALSNQGTFDPENDDITLSRRQRQQSGVVFGRDEVGRVNFGPGAKAYDVVANIANKVLTKLSMAPASDELSRAMRNMKVEVERVQNQIAGTAEELAKIPQVEREMISDVIEGELKAGVHPPQRVLQVAASMQSIMSEQSRELVRLGMLSQEAADRWDQKYLPRFYTSKLGDEVKAWAKATKNLFSRQPMMQGIRGSSLKARGLFETIDVADLATWQAQGWEQRDPDFDPATNTETVVWRDYTRKEREDMGEIRDAMFRFVMGYNRTQRDIALGRLYESLAQNYASKGPKDGYVLVPNTKVEGTMAPRYGKLAGKYVPREIMDQLSVNDEAMMEGLFKIYRAGLSKWKEGKTVLNPVSHANNVISNVTMAHFAGVSYWDAHKYAGAVKDLLTKDPMVAEAKDIGLFGGTFNQAEIVASMPPQLRAMAGMSESKLAKMGEGIWDTLAFTVSWNGKKYGARPVMQWAYENEDLFFRYVVYRDARKRGMKPEDAREYSQQFLFTYDDLPMGARIVRDVGMPFFAYTYKVVPVLTRTALEYPWRYAAPAALAYAVNAMMYAMAASLGGDEDDWWGKVLYKYATDADFRAKAKALEQEERKNLPDWMKGQSVMLGTPKAVRLGMDDATGLPLFLDISRIFPGGDLLDAQNNAGGVALLQPLTPSNPVLTTTVAMLANKDMFFGKEVVKETDTSAEKAQKRAAWLWRQVTPSIAVGNYHFDRGMNVLANITEKPITINAGPLGVVDYTGVGKDGLPVQPGYAAMQTFGVKVRPYDLEVAEKINKAGQDRLLRELTIEMNRIKRLETRGTISPEAADLMTDRLREKRDRLREGRTIDGDEKED